MADPMTTKTSSPSPPFPTPPMKYEVFVSFRGLDTRKGFTDHLYNALVRDGIHTFRDEEQLESGKPISKELAEAIAESQIFVVVLSRNYATSTWCLDELASMVELAANDESRLILPVFYDVTPSEVRKQTGVCFEEAFAKHEKDFEGETEKVTRWKSSLTTIADLSGFDLRHYRTSKGATNRVARGVEREVCGRGDGYEDCSCVRVFLYARLQNCLWAILCFMVHLLFVLFYLDLLFCN